MQITVYVKSKVTVEPEMTASVAAAFAAEETGENPGPWGLRSGDRDLPATTSLADLGVEDGDELELFETGG